LVAHELPLNGVMPIAETARMLAKRIACALFMVVPPGHALGLRVES
jgi:hypothetical protein